MPDVVSCIFAWSGLDRAALGVLGAGQRLAKDLGVKHAVLVVGAPTLPAQPPNTTERQAGSVFCSVPAKCSDGACRLAVGDTADWQSALLWLGAELAQFADSVHVADHPLLPQYHSETTLAALAQACRLLTPQAVLLGNDTYSQELAPRLAHRLGGSAVGDVLNLQVKDGTVLATRPVYGGKAQAVVALRRAPAVVWLRARAQSPAERQSQVAEIHALTLSVESDPRVKLVSEEKDTGAGAVRLEDARFIVSGGRGLGGPEPFKQLQELAQVMRAQMAASRAACDAGWVPPTWQVGQTGKKVAPELYLAIAVSGASQHLMGIADAKIIAAINTDRDAPIFGHCRFGLVEDYRKVIGLLQKKLSEARA